MKSELQARVDRAVQKASAVLLQARIDKALAAAKAMISPLDQEPPAPAVNVKPIQTLEVTVPPGKEGTVKVTPKRLKKLNAASLVAMDATLHAFHKANFTGNANEAVEGISRESLAKAHTFVLEELVRRGLGHPDRAEEDELDRVAKKKYNRFRRLYTKAAHVDKVDASCCRLCAPTAEVSVTKRDVTAAMRPWTHEVRVLKGGTVEEAVEERFVLGIVLQPEVVDAQQDVYNDIEIRKAAHGFMEKYGHIGLMHKQLIDGRVKILESYVAPTDFIVEGQHVKKGTWMLAARIVDDKLWKSVKDGKFNGWSIGGTAVKEPDPEYSALLALFGS